MTLMSVAMSRIDPRAPAKPPKKYDLRWPSLIRTSAATTAKIPPATRIKSGAAPMYGRVFASIVMICIRATSRVLLKRFNEFTSQFTVAPNKDHAL